MSFINRILKPFQGSKQVMIDRASKGYSRDLYSAVTRPFMGRSGQGTPAPENLNILLEMLQKDPVINTAITTRTNAIIDSGWSIEGKATPVSDAKKLLKKVGFDYKFIKKLVLNGLLYRHAFIEIERDISGNPAGLYILDTPQMEIDHDEHGEIKRFVQRAVNGKEVEWSTNDIVYIPFDSITTSAWGEVDLKTLYRTVATKNFVENFLNSLAESNAWRPIMKTKMQDDDIGDFLTYYFTAMTDPLQPLVMKIPKDGKADDDVFETLRDPKELKDFLGLLDYLRTQILMQLKTPPIIVGLPDNTNRSSGDSQFKIFNINNESDRKIIDGAFEELFEKLGISTVDFAWNPVDKRTTKDDVEIAEKLMNMGAKPKKVEEFLRLSGVELPEGEFFDKKPDVTGMSTPDNAASRPSRQREDKGAEMKTQGTGQESSTRDNQL